MMISLGVCYIFSEVDYFASPSTSFKMPIELTCILYLVI